MNFCYIVLLFLLVVTSCKKKNAPVLEITSISAEVQMVTYTVNLDYNGKDVEDRGICFSTTNELPTVLDDDFVSAELGSDSWTASVNGFETSTTYHFRAFITTKTGTDYSQAMTLMLEPAWVESFNLIGEAFCISVTNEDVVNVGGKSGWYARTQDGGETWDRDEEIYEIIKIDFPTPEVGYRSEFYDFDKTSNGGSSWSNVYPGGGQAKDVEFVNESVGYVAKFSDLIRKTTNGGLGWESFFVGVEEEDIVIDLCFLTVDIGYALTSNGSLFKTTDGAETWNLVNSTAIGVDSRSIDFLNENEGYLIQSNRVHKTVDGGSSWDVVYISDVDLLDVSFADSNSGVVVGNDAHILHTNDGGVSWDPKPNALIQLGMETLPVVAVEMVSPNLGYAIGGSRILKFEP